MGLGGRKLLALAILVLVGLTAVAYDSSVEVEARWRVLPYQSLSATGVNGNPALVSVVFTAATEDDLARGYVESEKAIWFHVSSNTAWKLQLRLAEAIEGLAARQPGGDYVDLSTSPIVLAAGPYGAYDIRLDLRRSLGVVAASGTASVDLIATIMPE